MPVRILSTGLPSVRFDDPMNPITEGAAYAAGQLLGLQPQLAAINAQNARDRAQLAEAADERAYRRETAATARQDALNARAAAEAERAAADAIAERRHGELLGLRERELADVRANREADNARAAAEAKARQDALEFEQQTKLGALLGEGMGPTQPGETAPGVSPYPAPMQAAIAAARERARVAALPKPGARRQVVYYRSPTGESIPMIDNGDGTFDPVPAPKGSQQFRVVRHPDGTTTAEPVAAGDEVLSPVVPGAVSAAPLAPAAAVPKRSWAEAFANTAR